jgi:hypothetical protein
MPWTPRITFELLTREGALVTGIGPVTFDERFQDVFSGVGVGQMNIDPGLASIPDTLATYAVNQHIRCLIDGTAVFVWRIEAPDGPTISKTEELGMFVTLQGRGWIASLDRAVTYPAAGVNVKPSPDNRIFSFASPDYPNEADGWVAATEQSQVSVIDPDRYTFDSAGVQAATPIGFPTSSAFWIWVDATDDEGTGYFRRTYTQAATQNVGIYATADNFYTLYLDGVPIMQDLTNPACWREYRPLEMVLSAGEHVFAAKVENLPLTGPVALVTNKELTSNVATLTTAAPHGLVPGNLIRVTGVDSTFNGGYTITTTPTSTTLTYAKVAANVASTASGGEVLAPFPNPGGFVFGMGTLNADGTVAETLLVSDDSWLALGYPADEPGWSAGQIIGTLLTEAQGRTILTGLTLGFTDDEDTATTEWPIIPWFVVPMGNDLLRVVQQLYDEGWVDFRMSASAFELQAWVKGTIAEASGITYIEGTDGTPGSLVDLTHSLAAPIRNVLLVRFPGDYVVVTDSGSVSTFGQFEGYLTTDSSSSEEATRKGQAVLDEQADAAEAAVSEIQEITQGVDCPFVDLLVGQTATIPNKEGDATVYRTVAQSCEVNANGEPTFMIEWNRRPW